jgi:hypothetical protein
VPYDLIVSATKVSDGGVVATEYTVERQVVKVNFQPTRGDLLRVRTALPVAKTIMTQIVSIIHSFDDVTLLPVTFVYIQGAFPEPV